MKKEDYLCQKIAYSNKIIKIYFDPEPLDPRKDQENAAILERNS